MVFVILGCLIREFCDDSFHLLRVYPAQRDWALLREIAASRDMNGTEGPGGQVASLSLGVAM